MTLALLALTCLSPLPPSLPPLLFHLLLLFPFSTQDLEDRMLLALHGCVVTAGDSVPDDGEYPVRILHQKWPHMMIEVMDLFMGVRAVINAGEKKQS